MTLIKKDARNVSGFAMTLIPSNYAIMVSRCMCVSQNVVTFLF